MANQPIILPVVDKLGEGVLTVEPGQRVAGYPRGGGYAEFICLPASKLVPVPSGLDPAELERGGYAGKVVLVTSA